MFYNEESEREFHQESDAFQALGSLLRSTNNGNSLPKRPFEKEALSRPSHERPDAFCLRNESEAIEAVKGMMNQGLVTLECQQLEGHIYKAVFHSSHIRARIHCHIIANTESQFPDEITADADQAWEDEVLKAQLTSVYREIVRGSGCTNTPETSELIEAGLLK